MSTIQEFCTWLTGEGFTEVRRLENQQVRFVADANTCVSFQHPVMGWAHVSEYVRGGVSKIECVLHPGLAGERTVHGHLGSAVARLAIIKQRTENGNNTFISEKKRKKVLWQH
jgi:hypothetical protein